MIFIGPSGAGKSTIAQELQRQGLVGLTPTVTERPRRPGETNANHIFVSGTEFDQLEETGQLLKVVKPFGLPYRYGLPPVNCQNDRIPSLIIQAKFLDLFARHYPNHTVYQIEAPLDLVTGRLKSRRTKSSSRLLDYQQEIEAGRQQADRLFVNDQPSIEPVVRSVKLGLKHDFQSSCP